MARATFATLLALVCVSAIWLSSIRADETQLQAAAEQQAFARGLKQLVPTEFQYSVENGINHPHIVKYNSVTTITHKKAEPKKEEEDEEEEPAKPEKGSVGDHAAAFIKKPFKAAQPHKIEKSYTQKVTKDYKVPPPAKVEVLLKEKPSAVIKVTKEHGGKAATATATASKDR
ncbi:hypothetical protein OEZ85_007143 [Tetradesmus obliquus]|uniref:Uncharacterized protein n=1 Tax=Tetradesmus obliquus TaxID=3088 RepID=A0ABY8U0U9_TETOB|nr:hypothetical protein OEZ85_007143 [Tetradesmus obliquus]